MPKEFDTKTFYSLMEKLDLEYQNFQRNGMHKSVAKQAAIASIAGMVNRVSIYWQDGKLTEEGVDH